MLQATACPALLFTVFKNYSYVGRMKKLKQVIQDIKVLLPEPSAELDALLAQYLFYAPKIPLRLAQEQLLEKAEAGQLSVFDEFFSGTELKVNIFKWGSGTQRIFITHGWGSKAADFTDIISALMDTGDVEVVAFDAPGNGSSEGTLSNLLLYVLAFKAAVLKYGRPDVVIGHSLGAMANVSALGELGIVPELLVSITPLIRLKENFEASMDALSIDKDYQARILGNFALRFGVPASHFTLGRYYDFNEQFNHWLFYDSNDMISPFAYLKKFMEEHPAINTRDYNGVGHERILKSPEMIADLVAAVVAIRF